MISNNQFLENLLFWLKSTGSDKTGGAFVISCHFFSSKFKMRQSNLHLCFKHLYTRLPSFARLQSLLDDHRLNIIFSIFLIHSFESGIIKCFFIDRILIGTPICKSLVSGQNKMPISWAHYIILIVLHL